jgi:hypothetical protein
VERQDRQHLSQAQAHDMQNLVAAVAVMVVRGDPVAAAVIKGREDSHLLEGFCGLHIPKRLITCRFPLAPDIA